MTGPELREHRTKLGVTQQQVANEAGVSKAYVSLVERGEHPSVQSLGIEQWARLLNGVEQAWAKQKPERRRRAGRYEVRLVLVKPRSEIVS